MRAKEHQIWVLKLCKLIVNVGDRRSSEGMSDFYKRKLIVEHYNHSCVIIVPYPTTLIRDAPVLSQSQ